MSEKIKLQHYVPRFYLQSFSIKGRKNYLYCFDKSKSNKLLVNNKNISSETYFYDTSEDDDQHIEKAFSCLESLFNFVYDKLIATEDLSCLTSLEKLKMAYFVVTQELRTKEHRAVLEDMVKQATVALSKRSAPKELIDKIKLSKEGIKSLHMDQLKYVPDYVDIVSKMKWILLINRTSMPFWCSDHPVNRFNNIDTKPYANLGLLSRGIEIHFPLSPTLSLCVCDPDMFSIMPSRYEIMDVEALSFHNWLQVYYSTRYVFSDKDDFSLAEEIIKDNPSLRNIDRKRLSVD